MEDKERQKPVKDDSRAESFQNILFFNKIEVFLVILVHILYHTKLYRSLNLNCTLDNFIFKCKTKETLSYLS